MKREDIERKVEETLQSLDGIQRASLSPFIFTRIEERMNNQINHIIPLRRAWAIACSVALIVTLNLWTGYSYRGIFTEDTAGYTENTPQYFSNPLSY